MGRIDEHTATQWKCMTKNLPATLHRVHPAGHECASEETSHQGCNGGRRKSLLIAVDKVTVSGPDRPPLGSLGEGV